MDNATLKAAIAAFVVVHFVVLVRRRAWPQGLVAMNALVAAGVLLAIAVQLRLAAPSVDWQVAGLAGFEAAALLATIAAWRGWPPGRWLAVAIAAVHLFAGTAALLVALTFKITRLI